MTALELHYEMEPGKAFQKTCRDMYAFVTGAASKSRKDIFKRQMSLKERKLFDPAKQAEIKNHVAKEVLDKLKSYGRPRRESILRMRWILEFRPDEDEKMSPNARIVTLGYLDQENQNRPAVANHQAATVTVRVTDGLLCSQKRRQRCIPAESQATARPLGATSTRTGSCPTRGSRRNHAMS